MPPQTLTQRFVCPKDRGELTLSGQALVCSLCHRAYPIARGNTPVFIIDQSSVFSQAEYVVGNSYEGHRYGATTERVSGLRRLVRQTGRFLQNTSSSLGYFGAADAIQHVIQNQPNPRVLVLGAGDTDCRANGCTVVHTDVAFGETIEAIVDAHDLPFPDGSFNLVIAVAVLEHVTDPQACVAEAHRVLAPQGWIYAVTPFLQPVHMGAHDFTRFTPLGHRRLFRFFDTLEWGVAMGPGSMFAYSLSALLESVSRRHQLRRVGKLLGLLVTPPLRKLDRLLSRSPSSWDAAAATYFFGSRRYCPLPDRDIIKEYKGGYRFISKPGLPEPAEGE